MAMIASFQRHQISRATQGLILGLLLVVGETRTQAQLLVGDNFDVGNVNSNSPGNWVLTVPPGSSTISIVDSSVTTPNSSPYCVRLVDHSTSGRPQMAQTFPPTD